VDVVRFAWKFLKVKSLLVRCPFRLHAAPSPTGEWRMCLAENV
jgi:hypothetical protein